MKTLIRCASFVIAVAGTAWGQDTPKAEPPEEVDHMADDLDEQVRDHVHDVERHTRDMARQASDQARLIRDQEREVRVVERQAHDLVRQALAQEHATQDSARAKERRGRDAREGTRTEDLGREDEAYQRGTAAIDGENWDDAIEAFESVAAANGPRTDAALYWKAYAQSKSGRRAEVLASLQDLRKRFPQSRWLRQAQALEMEVRQASGQTPNPDIVGDEELKLMALNGLMNMEAERAVPLLEKFLAGGSSPKLRERALFVLCQSGSPRAREVVVRIARGQQSPELQRKAVEYLGLFGGAESRQALSEIYASSSDIEVKKAVLRSFMLSGDKGRVLAAAKGEASPELRREAIQQLGIMGAQDELWALYQSETAAPAKRALINALFIGGNADRLIELARTEKDPQLRREAIQHLGLIGEKRTGAFLVSLYGTEKDPAVKRQVLQGLFLQGNAEALIEIARNEKDPGLRRDAVGQLSHMNSKLATDFMLEILNK
ncbi:MAG: HEAT repeat domain-containing protein [Solirubrobacterales bacterium]|jgi:HEAT repeat protein/TolA-binding protein